MDINIIEAARQEFYAAVDTGLVVESNKALRIRERKVEAWEKKARDVEAQARKIDRDVEHVTAEMHRVVADYEAKLRDLREAADEKREIAADHREESQRWEAKYRVYRRAETQLAEVKEMFRIKWEPSRITGSSYLSTSEYIADKAAVSMLEQRVKDYFETIFPPKKPRA